MAVKTYYLSRGNLRLTPNFLLSEFRTPGVDMVLLEETLPTTIDEIRATMTKLFGIEVGSCIINAGYRTAAYNRSVGGATNSPHLTGKAADFYFRDKNGKAIPSIYALCAAQYLRIKGIERIRDGYSVHIDIGFRTNYWWAYQVLSAGRYLYYIINDWFTSSWAKAVGIKPPTGGTITGVQITQIQLNSRGSVAQLLQSLLNQNGYTDSYGAKLAEDGVFGARSVQALKKAQKAKSLYADGICGTNGWGMFGLKIGQVA